ncbi:MULTISPECIES: hypothetical protein [unclassified Bacillus (in: firmicutes)]|uniref:hypothetical protein n=1 Tax=unclassified Bacillus (in: firmicutes) TaxID=185979 RepID=UPI000BF1363B|nr:MULTISPECIES: hypothetical protein [unclassified Bacillus (in: firmicutes)]PEJ52350.1 hypothetical protein CN692_21800 [Bacillus sp. AFS002410]PEL14264.1 hypothetical protein CN601_01585 [Bacillus sp. AFS017336]
MKSISIKTLFLCLPFIISILTIFIVGVDEVVNFVGGLILFSAFAGGVPFFVACLPYALVFYLIKKGIKVSRFITIISFILTIVALLLFLFGMETYYGPFYEY